MSCIEALLRESAPALETQVRSRLGGFFGAILRQYLPQTWVFRTETEVASLHVDAQGSVGVTAGERLPADVTIELEHERLRRALTRQPAPPHEEERPVRITAHTAKGKATYGLLKDRLGLPGLPTGAGAGPRGGGGREPPRGRARAP